MFFLKMCFESEANEFPLEFRFELFGASCGLNVMIKKLSYLIKNKKRVRNKFEAV